MVAGSPLARAAGRSTLVDLNAALDVTAGVTQIETPLRFEPGQRSRSASMSLFPLDLKLMDGGHAKK
jgi:hypothetical protein